MNYKHIHVSKTITIPVPDNLTPDEEANYIANRMAFVNLEELEADCQATVKLMDEENKWIYMEDVLAELSRETNVDGKRE